MPRGKTGGLQECHSYLAVSTSNPVLFVAVGKKVQIKSPEGLPQYNSSLFSPKTKSKQLKGVSSYTLQ